MLKSYVIFTGGCMVAKTMAISKCITLIINQSLHTGIFPDKFKIAKVTPIHNKMYARRTRSFFRNKNAI